MSFDAPTVLELRELGDQCAVALAARCARLCQHMYRSESYSPILRRAIGAAEQYASIHLVEENSPPDARGYWPPEFRGVWLDADEVAASLSPDPPAACAAALHALRAALAANGVFSVPWRVGNDVEFEDEDEEVDRLERETRQHAADGARRAMQALAQSTDSVGVDADGRRSTKTFSTHSARLDFEALRSARRHGPVPPHFFAVHTDSAAPVLLVVREFSDRLAALVANDSSLLEQLEWRDLERMLALIFERMGFDVELTRASHDGGRDLVLGCEVQGLDCIYLVEVKHWRACKVGRNAVTDFVRVVASEKPHGGLFLASYGYSARAIEAISEVDHSRISLGDRDTVVRLCRTYTKARDGIWQRSEPLAAMLFPDALST